MKKFYKENRVFSILMLVALTSLIIIAVFFLLYFFKGQSSNKYGNRLDGINAVKITSKTLTEYKNKLTAEPGVEGAEANIQGKIVYVIIDISKESGANTGVNAALKTINNFSEKELEYYDFNFIINKKDKDEAEIFPIMGYKKSTSASIIWTRY